MDYDQDFSKKQLAFPCFRVGKADLGLIWSLDSIQTKPDIGSLSLFNFDDHSHKWVDTSKVNG
jgi:hypothetical protein